MAAMTALPAAVESGGWPGLSDREGLTTVMQRHNGRLYRLARSIVKDDSEAEDVLQESYIRAFTKLEGFRGEASLGTWLATIVANEALQRVRRRRPTVELDAIAETQAASGEDGTPQSEGARPEHEAARHEIRRLIERAVDKLPLDFRAVFVLRAIEQMSIEETAVALGIRPETVKTRFHRANRQLRAALGADLDRIFDSAFPFLGARCDRIVAAVLARLGVAARAAPSSSRGGERG
jgi:RNA polymerase sigma-70 factor (ECF subfamily)